MMPNKMLWKSLSKLKGKKLSDILYKLCNSLDGKPFILRSNMSSRVPITNASFAMYVAMNKTSFLSNKLKYFIRKIRTICMNRKTRVNDGMFKYMKSVLDASKIDALAPTSARKEDDSEENKEYHNTHNDAAATAVATRKDNKILAYTPRAVAMALSVEHAAAMNYLVDGNILDICRRINDIPYHKLFLLHYILQNYTSSSTNKVKSLDVTSLFCQCWVKCVSSPYDVEKFINNYKMVFCATCKCNIRHSSRKIKKPHFKCDSTSFARRCNNEGSSLIVDDQPLVDMLYDPASDMLSYCARIQFHQPVPMKMMKHNNKLFTYADDSVRFTGVMEFSSTFMMPCMSRRNRKCYQTITSKRLDSNETECDTCSGSSWWSMSRRKKRKKDRTCVKQLQSNSKLTLKPCVGCLIHLSCHHNRDVFLSIRDRILV